MAINYQKYVNLFDQQYEDFEFYLLNFKADHTERNKQEVLAQIRLMRGTLSSIAVTIKNTYIKKEKTIKNKENK